MTGQQTKQKKWWLSVYGFYLIKMFFFKNTWNGHKRQNGSTSSSQMRLFLNEIFQREKEELVLVYKERVSMGV
jgi:hypothetical protein